MRSPCRAAAWLVLVGGQIATALQWKGNQLLYPIHDSGDRPAFIYGLYLAHAL